MISFKNFLTESRSAPLYHATRFENANKILKENILKPSPRRNAIYNDKPVEQGISLTRDIKTARDWIPQNAAIFVLDQSKIIQRYKVIPINIENLWAKAWATKAGYDRKNSKSDGLREELVTKAITDFDKYIIEILVENNSYNDIHKYTDLVLHRKLKLQGKFVNQ